MRRLADRHPLFGAMFSLLLAVVLSGALLAAYREHRAYGIAPVEVDPRTFQMPDETSPQT